MTSHKPIQFFLEASSQRYPDNVAIRTAEGEGITYRGLAGLSDGVRDRLVKMGVCPGDRVGVCITKSIDTVAAIFGVLKAGAAYVPLDPHAPIERNAYILHNCGVKAAILEDRVAPQLQTECNGLGAEPAVLVVEGAGTGEPLRAALDAAQRSDPADASSTVENAPDDLAYILYTSGSTGRPKGVMLTHENAVSFVQWCRDTFLPTPEDVFSSHAPFHFDLSILDIYVPLSAGATLVLIGHQLGKEPGKLVPVIAERGITVWYSTPTTLMLMVQYGDIASHDLSALRAVLFAGEVFPVKHLQSLQRLIPHPRFFNLYGPTETNVCTFYEVRETVPEERTEPYPIGPACSHCESRVVDASGQDVPRGDEGELVIRGAAVTQGYWDLPEQTANAFFPTEDGRPWYRTGDLVVEDADGDFIYRGRRDRMVKKRGYRVELGEIEACLYGHENVQHVAVVAPQSEQGIAIHAFVSTHDGQRISVIQLKKFCSERLPMYMIPDRFSFHDSLPTTSTDKIDYQALLKMQ